ncbi:hypothetical protein DZF91_13155 [Actinomadura logoneensis]|uniref:DUF4097 domain-containing protein n=1 Tax=Actinomadura logoneensis TaxID=2293572 RepID=A0A372JMI9_9ACTN|nr:DUF4097 family beta strand repeat-containing protein [Actinomadura logoneensis]RFU41222.1 hypothetical protein DZF91_13155 [Actinomadura logoneensis]
MRKFDTTAPITAVLDVPAGRVRIVAGDEAVTTVEVLPADAAKGRDVKAAEQTAVEYADGVLRIQGPTGNQYFGASGALAVTVGLPAGSRVEATTASVEFTTAGRLGDVAYEGAHGTVAVEDAASVTLTTAAGDVEIGRLGGSARITVSKGDIRIAEASAGTVELSTRDGDVSVGAAAGVSASLDAGTPNGRIVNELRNDGDTRLDIRATSANGDITARSL